MQSTLGSGTLIEGLSLNHQERHLGVLMRQALDMIGFLWCLRISASFWAPCNSADRPSSVSADTRPQCGSSDSRQAEPGSVCAEAAREALL